VTRDLSELLRDAADDRGRPLPFTPQDLVERGRRRALRHVWGWTSVWAAAAVGVLIVLTQLLTRPESPPFPAPPPPPSTSTSPTSTPPSTPSPISTTVAAAAPPQSDSDRTLVTECGRTAVYPPVAVPSFDPSSPPTSFPMPSPTTSDLTGWRVVLRADDQFGTSAGLVSADGTQYVVCNRVHDTSSEHQEELHEMKPPQNGPVPSWWTDPANVHLVDHPLGWSQICQIKANRKICPDELIYGVGPAYEGVARVHIEWPDKTSSDYPVTNGYYVARHLEKRVERPVDPKVREGQSLPSFYISFYDATGNLIVRYDHNPSMPIPTTCPTDHGC
jgi:hypothetical protein